MNRYKEYLKELSEKLENLKEDMLDDKKLSHISDIDIMKDIDKIESSIENIEYLLGENNRI